MYAMQNKFRLSAVAIALMSVFGSALADDAEIAELIKPESAISVGAGSWSSNRHQLGIYDGMRDAGVFGLFDADIVKRDDETGTWMKFKATNLGLDDREARGEYLRQGNFGITLDYNRLVRDNPNTYNTSLSGIGTNNLTEHLASTPKSAVSLGTVREGVGLGIYKNLAPGFDLNITFKNEEKTGTRAWGRGGPNSFPEFAVEPINSTIRQIEGTLSYITKTWQLSGGYYGSWYDNHNNLVTDNTAGQAVFSGATLNTTYLSLPLDNQAHQFFLNGGYNFTPTTRATMKLAYTYATQDVHLPTRDINIAGFGPVSFANAPNSLSGVVNTTLMQLGVTSRPIQDLSLLANLRFYDSHDETPTARFVQTNAACGQSQCVDNTPFSYRNLSGKAEGTYRFGDGYGLTAGVEERLQDRTVPVSNANGASVNAVFAGDDTQRVVPMRSHVDETTWRLELRRSMSETLNGSLAYLFSQRRGSSYDIVAGPANGVTNGINATNGGAFGPSNMINPINVADRDRNKVRLAMDWAPVESLSLQFNAEAGQDRYGHNAARPYGLEQGTTYLYSFDATYALSEKWKINTWYSFDLNAAKQANSRSNNGGANGVVVDVLRKDDKLQDKGENFGLGLRGEVTSKIRVGGDLLWARNVGKYDQADTIITVNPGGIPPTGFTAGLPDIENKMLRINLFTMYALDKSSDLRFDVINEHWKTNDWTWLYAGGTPFTYGGSVAGVGTVDGTTVTSNPRQNSTFIGMRYIYKFQ